MSRASDVEEFNVEVVPVNDPPFYDGSLSCYGGYDDRVRTLAMQMTSTGYLFHP